MSTLLRILCLFVLAVTGSTAVAWDLSDIDNSDIEALKVKYPSAEFTQSNFTLNDAKQLLRKKCQKAAGGIDDPHVYKSIEQAAIKLMQCANSIANLTEVLAEVEAARPNGDLDVVFQKYCDKRPRAEQCLQEFNAQLMPCLSATERDQNVIMMRIISSLLGFICYKNGDQIALFIAEEGPECIETNKENIANCMNATFAAYLPKAASAAAATTKLSGVLQPPEELPELVMNSKQCIDLYDFEECVLGYLEQCNEITPANIIESIFRYVKKEAKCQPDIDKVQRQKQLEGIARNGVALTVATWTFVLASLLGAGMRNL